MKHGEFRQKLAVAKSLSEFDGSNRDAALKFGILPVVAATRRRYFVRHRCDPQCPWMDDISNATVLNISRFVSLESLEAARKNLIERFQYDAESAMKPWPCGVPKRIIRLALKKSGLRWFNQNEMPYVHWSEKAEAV